MHDTMQDIMARRPKGYEARPKQNPAQLQRMQELLEEMKCLMERNDSIFDDESVRREMTMLERWMESYRSDLVSMDTFCETSVLLLADLRTRLKLAAEELQRLEGEGGNPASKEQVDKNEQLLKAVRRSEKLFLNIEELCLSRKQ